jgi:hypothetical protein
MRSGETRRKHTFQTCAAGIPNFFIFAGPNCSIGHGSVPPMLYWAAGFMLECIEKMATEDIKYVSVLFPIKYSVAKFK